MDSLLFNRLLRQSRPAPFIWNARRTATPKHEDYLADRFRRHVSARKFPCVGAKAALARGQLRFRICANLASAWDDLALLEDLQDFAARYRRQPLLFSSFVAIFREPRHLDEEQFERFLWQRLQSLHDKDVWMRQPQDRSVSSDPASPHFSLSLGGSGFFVVGLHPRASRLARRFSRPALVFNLHQQFTQLRADGRFQQMRDTIARRDAELNGAPNPMLANHGDISEARQYSGRQVGDDWTCPFKPGPRP